ncbi:sorbosone dehydrogenase family protein [Cryobacterium sp. BB736]|uniref:PQQ-dependent sugar dehydrogenase n=1 Tax=Cryobacterium sp. BB736 TaxID=2746963 RepID=UPI001D0BF201|nr:PQQ-dependent sugar dehydrogenase [Cryobacterium sp. BB736]
MVSSRMLVAAVALGLLVGCTSSPGPTPSGSTFTPPASSPQTTPVQPAGTPEVLATGLTSPWSVARLTNGSALISERDTALIKELTDGEVREVGTIDGVVPAGEGGLLGIATLELGDTIWLYAYFTGESDNRVIRMLLNGRPGAYSLGDAEPIITGIRKASNHNGGRIAFGPDGNLFVTAGDAGDASLAQDPNTLNGKILRLEPDGSVPVDNPTSGSPVYSFGHRNPQGLAWDEDGQLWASEFGQNTWDELNRITAGGNYGWPIVEGVGQVAGLIDPVYQWPTSDASPSGLAYIDQTLFMAALRGERLWAIYPFAASGVDAVAWFEGEFGRLRDAVPGPDGSLWVLTNNTDGRGNPREGDDKLMQVRLEPLREG